MAKEFEENIFFYSKSAPKCCSFRYNVLSLQADYCNMERTTYRMPTHPGDVVKEELEERGISQKEFASRTGISYTMLNEILNSKRPITSEIALVIEAALGINPELLINMQSRYNMVQARMKPAIESNLAHIRKVCASWLL